VIDLPADSPLLSVIVPARDESAAIAATLRAAADPRAELVVVDGESTDDTAALAEAGGARVIAAQPGRATQLAVGVEAAAADTLLMLHADTLLPAGYVDLVLDTLGRPGVAAGAFGFALDAAGRVYRAVEWGTRLRCRLRQLPYGDQGLFMRRATLDAAGGVPRQPAMEDYVLVRRLRRLGRVVTLDTPAVTSARRWRRGGVARTTLVHQLMILGHHAGVAPDRLARFRERATR